MSVSFASLGVPEHIVRALKARQIHEPFPIQVATISDGLNGRDLCGKAPTGSGKTIAFGIPMVANVTRSAPKKPHGLVLVPTRELAIQVAEEFNLLGTDLRILATYGGASIEPQIKKIRAGVDIIVATPGRLIDLIDRKVCDLRSVTFVVLDEADRMADMGFMPVVKRILDMTPDKRQTVLFSATLDGDVDELVKRYQTNPVIHELEAESEADLTHHFWLSERAGRVALVSEVVDRLGSTIVFCRTKHGADRVARQLTNAGVKSVAIHGNRSQSQRERALESFHHGSALALVATDVAARGIHVEGVQGVVHFDLPADPKDYIHRSGRTGRAGNVGTVVALVDPKGRKDAVKLKRSAGIEAEIVDPDIEQLPQGGPRPPKRKGPKAKAPSNSSSKSSARQSERSRYSERVDASPDSRTVRSTKAGSPKSGGARTAHKSKSKSASSEGAWSSAKPSTKPSTKASSRPSSNASARSTTKQTAKSPSNRPAKQSHGSQSSSVRSDNVEFSGPGAAKVRPSGASRRKAKREALAASGQEVTRTKKRRSGKPRPAPKR